MNQDLRRKITIMPDWVCEILSPSTQLGDRTKKLPLYAHAGVGHVWFVDPAARTIEVYVLEAGRWVVAITSGGDERVRLPPFEGVELDLSRWQYESGSASSDAHCASLMLSEATLKAPRELGSRRMPEV